MLKKCISLVLSLIMLSGIGSIGAFAWDWPWEDGTHVDPNYGKDLCSIKNKAEGYLDLGCAESKGILEVRSIPDKRWFIEKVGKDADHTLHFWPYNTLSRFASFFGKSLFDAKTEQEIAVARQNAVQEVMLSFGLRWETAEEVVNGLFQKLKFNNLSKEEYLKDAADKVRKDSYFVGAWGIVSALVVGGAAAVISIACPPVAAAAASIAAKSALTIGAAAIGGTAGSVFSASSKASEQSAISQARKIDISNYVSAIEQMLSCIKLDCWKNGNILYINFCSNPQKYYASVDFLNLDLKGNNDHDSYFKTFESLKNELPDLLNKNK